jgi:hypothetical protein
MEINFEPYQKITFKSYLKYENAETFADSIASASPPDSPSQVRLLWANGVLFRFFNFMPSEAIAKEFINGHIIFDHIEFAPMSEFKKELKLPDKAMVTITVLDSTNHVIFNPLTAWIRDNLLNKH